MGTRVNLSEAAKRSDLHIYHNDVSVLLTRGPGLVETLEAGQSIEVSNFVRAKLRELEDCRNRWALHDPVDIVTQAYLIYETINTIGHCLQELEPIFVRNSYPRILEPCKMPFLHDQIRIIVDDKALQERAKKLRGAEATAFIDRLTEALDAPSHHTDGGKVLRLLQSIVETAGELPTQVYITGVSDMNFKGHGGQADIYKCRYQDMHVAARVIRLKTTAPVQVQREIRSIHREIMAHRQVKHPNILPLLGVFRAIKDDGRYLSIITPWMENGTASQYLETHTEAFTTIVRGLVAAVSYLHSCRPPIVHSDIKPFNVLINNTGKAMLSDFGFARIRHEHSRTGTQLNGGGTEVYQAPEILSGDVFRGNVYSDTYSCSITILELATREHPLAFLGIQYHNDRPADRPADDPEADVKASYSVNPNLIKKRVEQGERPQKPPKMANFPTDSEAPEYIWKLLSRMWDPNPQKRPTMMTVEEELDRVRGDGSLTVSSMSSEEILCARPSADKNPVTAESNGLDHISGLGDSEGYAYLYGRQAPTGYSSGDINYVLKNHPLNNFPMVSALDIDKNVAPRVSIVAPPELALNNPSPSMSILGKHSAIPTTYSPSNPFIKPINLGSPPLEKACHVSGISALRSPPKADRTLGNQPHRMRASNSSTEKPGVIMIPRNSDKFSEHEPSTDDAALHAVLDRAISMARHITASSSSHTFPPALQCKLRDLEHIIHPQTLHRKQSAVFEYSKNIK